MGVRMGGTGTWRNACMVRGADVDHRVCDEREHTERVGGEHKRPATQVWGDVTCHEDAAEESGHDP